MRISYKSLSVNGKLTNAVFTSVERRSVKLSLITFLLLSLVNVSLGQTLLDPTADGGFESGTTFTANGWTAVNPTDGALWQIGTAATGYSGSRGAFVGTSTSAYGYSTGSSRTCHLYRDITVPAGVTGISLSWALKGTGESGYDRLLVYTAPTTVTPAANTPASNATTLTGATLVYTQPLFYSGYTSQTVALPSGLAGTTFRLIFTWQNDASGGTNPGAAIDDISLTYYPICASTPSGVYVNASNTWGCSTYNSALTLGGTRTTGLTYQWQSSPDSVAWTNVSAATNESYTASVSADVFYRCVLTCPSGGTAFNTAGVKLLYSAIAPLPYMQGFEGITTNHTLPPCMAATNLGTTSTSYTRTYIAPTGSYNQAARTGNCFGSFRYSSNDWFFTPAFSLTAGNTYVFSFWYITDGGSGWTTLQTKYGTSQTSAGMTTAVGTPVSGATNQTYAQYTGTITPTTSGTYYIGINCVATSSPNYLSIDDISMVQVPNCTGAPSGISVTASNLWGCSTYSSVLGLSGLPTTAGYTYQWQSSSDSTAWSSVSGATNTSYTASVSANIYYRCVVTCGYGGGAFNTPGVKLQYSTTSPLPYTQSFESITANNTLPPCMTSTNLSTYTRTYIAPTGSYNQAARTGKNYASFRWGANDWFFTPGFSLTAGNTYVFSFWYVTDGSSGWTTLQAKYGTAQTSVGMTTAVGTPVSGANNTTYIQYTGTITPTSTGTFYVGINCTANSTPNYLSIDDISLVQLPTCTSTPSGISVTASNQWGCSTYSSVLGLNGVPGLSGYTYQWQSSSDSSAWSNVSGATIGSYTASVTGDIYYRCVVTCSFGGSAFNTPGVKLRYSPTAPLPYTQSFEGITANHTLPPCMAATNLGSTSYTRTYMAPTGSSNQAARTGNSYASFRYGANDWFFTPGFSLTAGYTYVFSFWYVTDGGSGWTTLHAKYGTSQTSAGMTAAVGTPVLGATNSSYVQYSGTFTATSSGTFYIGINCVATTSPNYLSIDDINVVELPMCSGTPTAGTVNSTISSACVSASPSLTLSGATSGFSGLRYQWQSSTDGTTGWIDIPGATTDAYAPVVTSTTYYRQKLSCGSADATTTGTAVTINPLPPAITGSQNVCLGGTTSLNNTITGGTWSSSTPSVAGIDASSGVVSGAAAGAARITYTSPAGCRTTTLMFVNTVVPTVSASASPSVICSGSNTSLTAAPVVVLPNTYDIATIPYSFTTPTTPTVVSFATLDDDYTAVSLPFAFNFWGTSYSTAYIGTNGYISFGAGSVSRTVNSMPISGFPASIVYALSDLKLISPASVTYSTEGVAPNRVFVVTFDRISQCCTDFNDNYDAQIKLYETTNTIDLLVSNTVSGSHSMGIQNAGTQAVTPVGRNNVTYGIAPSAPEAYRFSIPQDSYSWTPSTSLASTTGLTVAANSVTATPSGVYTVTRSYRGCASTATTTVSVNPLPDNIGGTAAVCEGLTTLLSNVTPGGTWESSALTKGTIDAAGVLTGIEAGTTTVSYTLTTTGCRSTKVVTINQAPSAIGGTANICAAASATLTNAIGSGSWTSSSPAVAAITPAGVITGGVAGLSKITYTLPTGCVSTREVTVNPIPTINVTPTTTSVCQGDSASLSLTSPVLEFSLLNENFNTSLGMWTVTTTVDPSDGVSPWNRVSTSSMDIAGDGTAMIEAAPSASTASGLTTTYLISPVFSTVGISSANLTFNEHLYSSLASDINVKVQYSLDEGATWTTFIDQMPVSNADTTVGSGIFDVSNPEVDVSLPAAALNAPAVKLRWFYETNWGGWWQIDNVAVKVALPAPTFTWAGIGSATGLSCTSCPSPKIAPAVIGANVYNVTANSTCSSNTNVTVNVNQLPGTIGGASSILCVGSTINLSNSDAGGSWSSSNTSIASVDASTGVVAGNAMGSVVLSYILPNTCARTVTVNVEPSPSPIIGTLEVCDGFTTSLSHDVSGGVWSSGSALASVNAIGVVTGSGSGNAIITYVLPSGCRTLAEVTVNELPALITGTRQVCEGSTTVLGSTPIGGTWSGSTAEASVDAATGEVSGIHYGVSFVTYTLSTGCSRSAAVTVNALPGDIAGTFAVCQGLTTSLTSTAGGQWTSSNTAIADVDASGIVTGVADGTARITYAIVSTGCMKSFEATVNPLPADITGALQVCEGLTTSLSNATPLGSWSAAPSTVASIDAAGVVNATAAGTQVVTYALSTGCIKTANVVVNPLPADIAGTLNVCAGLTTSLSTTTTGGSWSGGDALVATIAGSGVVSAVSAGTTTVTYTLNLTGCLKTAEVLVNRLPDGISGGLYVCEGLTTTLSNNTVGGVWSTNAPAVASIDADGIVSGIAFGSANIRYTLLTGCFKSVNVTVRALPADIGGTLEVCPGLTTTLTDATTSGTWSGGDAAIATIDASGIVSGVAAGTADVMYTAPNGCSKTAAVLVNSLPADISGVATVCEASNTNLTNTTPGGVWSTSASTIADVDILSGVVSGSSSGTATITYALMTGCIKTAEVTVNALPAPFTGTMEVCKGLTTTLSSTAGGAWFASSPNATIDAAGVVTGLAAGAVGVTYTLSSGCSRTANVVVNALPATYNVTGGGSYCMGSGGSIIGIDGSESGVSYQLYNGSSTVGSAAAGLGTAISFGSHTTTGTYSVAAIRPATGCVNNMAGDATITILPLTVPSVTVASGAGTSVCAGTSVTYSATPVNGGTLPAYRWEVNGVTMPATSTVFSYTPANGDVVKVILTSNASCATPAIAIDAMVMSVQEKQTPVVIAIPTGVTSVCQGASVTLSAASIYGGSSPIYDWYVNSSLMTSGSTFSYIPNNGDLVSVKLTSNYVCLVVPTATSEMLIMTTSPEFIPVVSLSVTPGAHVPAGTEVTFTAVVDSAGPSPSFQWYKNGTAITGATGITYTTNSLNNNDSISCKVVGTNPCGHESFNSVIMRINHTNVGQLTGGIANISLVPNPNKGEFVVKGQLTSSNDEEISLEVTNMLGQTVYKSKAVTKRGSINESIQLNNSLANGMYMLNLRTGDEAAVFHFVLEQ